MLVTIASARPNRSPATITPQALVIPPRAADGNGSMKELLGGKGANLAEMCRLAIPVPAGFTISTEACAV